MENREEKRVQSYTRRAKMDREERAKQFMPFDALKGFREALREKEKEVEMAKTNSR